MLTHTWRRGTLGLGTLLVLLAAEPARAECWVQGSDVDIPAVTVRALGKQSFETGISGLTVRALLPRKPQQPTALVVEDRLTFQGTTQQLLLFLKEAFVSTDGLVRLAPGTQVMSAYFDGQGVVATVVLSRDVFSQEGASELSTTLSWVKLPCNLLTLDTVATDTLEQESSQESEWFELKKPVSKLRVFQAPRGKTAFILEHPNGLAFEKIGQEEGWMKVRLREEGVDAQVFLPEKDVEAVLDEGRPFREKNCCEAVASKPLPLTSNANHLRGMALVSPLAKIYSKPGAGLWATLQRELEVEVLLDETAEFVEVVSIPGLEGLPVSRAWVERDELEWLEAGVP